MADSVTMRPAQVTSWGQAARHGGSDIRTARAQVTDAEDEMSSARAAGMACKGASQRYTDAFQSTLGTVAEYVTGTGDKLVQTAAMVEATDQENVDTFEYVGGRP